MNKFFGIFLALGLAFSGPPALAQEQAVIATVNDLPVTSYDVEQRIRWLKMLGANSEGNGARKVAANEVIDELVTIFYAKKGKADATDAEIKKQTSKIASSLKTDDEGFAAKLKANNVSEATVWRYVNAQISFSRILRGKFKVKNDVVADKAEVDRKYNEIKSKANKRVAEIMNDPRMRPISVYALMEIGFPLEASDGPELLQARAIEAQQFLKKFKGCKSARGAASGIFNVKIGKIVEADGAKLPKPMKSALDKNGVGRALGPMRSKSGIQLLALCSKRTITPPKPKFDLPTRDQIERSVTNQKFAAVEAKYMKELRKSAIIEYRDLAYAQ
jgi:peptidyl-prolyl cis-trans isomerase SurA